MKKMKKIFISIMMVMFFAISVSEVIPELNTTIEVQAASPKLNKSSLLLLKSQSYILKLTDSTSKVKWSSSNKKIATVTSKGKVTAVRAGKAKITASVGNRKYYCNVTVEAPKLNKTKLTLNKGKSYILKVTGTKQKIVWSTSNKKIATVKNGVVRAVRTGNVSITANIGKSKLVCKIVIRNNKPIITPSPTPTPIPIIEVDSIELDRTQVTVEKGKMISLQVSYYPSNADIYKETVWNSSNTYIADVDDYGNVSANNVGVATISVDYGGIIAQCEVTVGQDRQTLINEAYQRYLNQKESLLNDVNNRYKQALASQRNKIYEDISRYQQLIRDLKNEGYYYWSESEYRQELSALSKKINTLKAQIGALEGTTNPASKARLARLKAELSDVEAEEEILTKKYRNKCQIEAYNTMINSLKNELNNIQPRLLEEYQKEFDTKAAELYNDYLAEVERIKNMYE